MSDSLDDFFAKKDKKKKGKAKLTNNDLMVPEEEQKIKKLKKKKKESETKPADAAANSEPANEQQSNKTEDEDWSEYVEEKETDYSGLRIQAIQIRDEDQGDQGEKGQDKGQDGEEGEDGEEQADGPSGPWAAVDKPPVPQQQAQPEPPKKEEPVVASVRTGKYVPPSMRNQSASSMDAAPLRRMRKKEAPNLKSEEDFPTLGGGPPEDIGGAWGSGARFEKVKSGGRQMDEQTSRGPRIELGNKYDALRGGAD